MLLASAIIAFNLNYFSVKYDTSKHCPKEVAYRLDNRSLISVESRDTIDFYQDKVSINPNEYRGSGYDKGHLYPSDYAEYSKPSMYAAFSMLNACFQTPNLNRGKWRVIEKNLLDSLKTDSIIEIRTGPIYCKNQLIPTHYYKSAHILKKYQVWVCTNSDKASCEFYSLKKDSIPNPCS